MKTAADALGKVVHIKGVDGTWFANSLAPKRGCLWLMPLDFSAQETLSKPRNWEGYTRHIKEGSRHQNHQWQVPSQGFVQIHFRNLETEVYTVVEWTRKVKVG